MTLVSQSGLCLLSAFLAWGANAASPLNLPVAHKLPTIDGVIREHEYDEGVCFCGLKTIPSDRLAEQGEGTVTFWSDRQTLVMAARLRTRNVDHDGGLNAEDHLELMVAGADAGRRASVSIDPFGKTRTALYYAASQVDRQWRCSGLKAASRVNRGWWEVELSLPLGSLGDFRSGIKVNVGRSGPGMPPSSLTGVALGPQSPLLDLVWNAAAAAVQVSALGDPAAGEWQPQLDITAARSPLARYRADFFIGERNHDGTWIPRQLESKLLKLGEKFAPRFVTSSKKDYRMELAVRDAQTGIWLYRQEWVAKRTPRGGDIPVTVERELPGLGSMQVFYYPGYRRARVNLYPIAGLALKMVAVRIGECTTKLRMEGRSYTALATVPEELGEHPLTLAALTSTDEKLKFPAVCTLDRRHWEWEGHSLGLERVILPPFKPIEAHDSSAAVVHRRYQFGAAGLPKSVIALGRELLAAPIHFEGVIDGRSLVFTGAEAQLSAAADGYEATIVGAASADGVKIAGSSRLEYDGFMYGTFALSGIANRRVERLTLVVPLKDAESPLMHIAMADSIRANPTGKVPTGNGLVWDGTRLARSEGQGWNCYAPQSVPYVWLGAERRGLSWFTDNTCGMELDPRQAAVRLRRTLGVLQLELDLVNQPLQLKDGHQFTFGFEATPVKTATPALIHEFQTGVLGCPEGMVPRLVVNSIGLGFWNGWARRPYGNDWRLFVSACQQVTQGGMANEYIQCFKENVERNEEALKAYCANLPKIGPTPHYDWFRSCRAVASKTIRESSVRAMPLKYSDPTLCWSEEAEEKHFKSEWVSRKNGYTAASRNFLTKSYMDFSLFHYHKEISLGMTGVYLDDMFPMTCRNRDICGQTDAAGRFHGDFGLLAMRELVKRIAVIQHQAGIKSRLLQVHMTNCLLVPCFAFATSQLSWEDHYGETVFQTRFKDDYVRAESLGGQIGAEAVALDGIKPRDSNWQSPEWDQKLRFLTRTQQAMLLPAGVKTWLRPPWPPKSGVHREELFAILSVPGRFGAWQPDAVFTPYYEYDGSLGPLPTGLHVGRWQRGSESLYVLGNQTDQPITVKLPKGVLTVPPYDLRFY